MAAVGFVVPRITYHGIGTLEKLKELDGEKGIYRDGWKFHEKFRYAGEGTGVPPGSRYFVFGF